MTNTLQQPRPDGCLVTVVNNLSLDDNQNCETLTVAVDDNDNMACIVNVIIVVIIRCSTCRPTAGEASYHSR